MHETGRFNFFSNWKRKHFLHGARKKINMCAWNFTCMIFQCKNLNVHQFATLTFYCALKKCARKIQCMIFLCKKKCARNFRARFFRARIIPSRTNLEFLFFSLLFSIFWSSILYLLIFCFLSFLQFFFFFAEFIFFAHIWIK